MTVILSVEDVFDMTSVEVSAADITVADDMLYSQTGYTADEHNTDRNIGVETCRMAWAMVAARVHESAGSATGGAVTGETQGDYSYSEDGLLAKYSRFANLTDGSVRELLNLSKAEWSHI